MAHTNLTDFFNANIAPNFEEFGWQAPEINALRGAFLLGAKFVIDNATSIDGTDDFTTEIEAFEADVAKRTQNN